MLNPSDPTRVYLTLSATLSFAFTLAFTLQGLYFVTVAKLDPLQLLLIGATLEGAAFLLEVPTGVVADVYSRRCSVILGCLCLGIAMVLVAAFPIFWALLLTQVVSAAGYTFLSGAQQAWLADLVGAVVGAGLNFGLQLYQNHGDVSKVNVGPVLLAAAAGGTGAWLGTAVASVGVSLAGQVALNSLGGAVVSYGAAKINNAANFQYVDPNKAAFYGGVFGGASTLVGEGLGGILPAGASALRGSALKGASGEGRSLLYGGSITSGTPSMGQTASRLGGLVGGVSSNITANTPNDYFSWPECK